MKHLGVAALAALTTLAVPAVASAHPSVYTTTANVIKAGTTDQIEPQTRYVVTNHGFTMVLRETNKLNATAAVAADKVKGVVGYNLIPGGWRTGKAFDAVMAVGGTGVQVHATCLTPALQTETAIKSWQDADAFYNYVPFQSAPAGFEDDPARWLPTLTTAGFDTSKLGTAAAAEAECEKVAGAEYVPADTVQTTAAALAAGTVAEATEPLTEEVEALTTANGTLTTEKSTLTDQVAALTTEVEDLKKGVFASNPLQSQVTALTAQLKTAQDANAALVNRPLLASLNAKRFDDGVALITGKAGAAVTVTMRISSADAKKLKISKTLSTKKATLDAQGAGLVNLTLSGKAAKAIDKAKGTLKVTVTATSGNETSDVSGTLTR